MKEMEEPPEVPTDHDQIRFCPKRSASSLDQDEPVAARSLALHNICAGLGMAIGDEIAGAICDEP